MLIQLDSHGNVQLHRILGELILERWPSSAPARRFREEQEALQREAEEAERLARAKAEREAKQDREQAEREALLRFKANGMLGRPPMEIPIAWVRDLLTREAATAADVSDSREAMAISRLYQDRKSFVKAAAFAQQAADLDSHEATRLRYAAALRRIRLLEEARDVYGDVLRSRPEDFRTWTGLAAVLADLGEDDDARIAIEKVVSARPNDSYALLAAGRIARNQRDLEASERYFLRAADHGADRASVEEELRKLAERAREQGRDGAARRIEQHLASNA